MVGLWVRDRSQSGPEWGWVENINSHVKCTNLKTTLNEFLKDKSKYGNKTNWKGNKGGMRMQFEVMSQ